MQCSDSNVEPQSGINLQYFVKKSKLQNFTNGLTRLEPTVLTQTLSSSCKSFPSVSLNNKRRRCGRGKAHISWKLLFIGDGPWAISISLCRRPADPLLPFTLSLSACRSISLRKRREEEHLQMSNITLHYRLGWNSELCLGLCVCVWLNLIKKQHFFNIKKAEEIKYWRFLSKTDTEVQQI